MAKPISFCSLRQACSKRRPFCLTASSMKALSFFHTSVESALIRTSACSCRSAGTCCHAAGPKATAAHTIFMSLFRGAATNSSAAPCWLTAASATSWSACSAGSTYCNASPFTCNAFMTNSLSDLSELAAYFIASPDQSLFRRRTSRSTSLSMLRPWTVLRPRFSWPGHETLGCAGACSEGLIRAEICSARRLHTTADGITRVWGKICGYARVKTA
mmetsp:Transcript_62755/g.173949  ORF Transcript_62755/g.173949 Transcript_62755/m.173949 type:complete len:216 (+) Transcript_62755:228-875(+)